MRRIGFGLVRFCFAVPAGLCVLFLGGCVPKDITIDVRANPPIVRPGGHSNLSVTVTNPQSDVSYLWKPERGDCSPKSSTQKSTVYTAPDTVGQDHITLAVVQNGTDKTLIEGEVIVDVVDQPSPKPTQTATPTPTQTGTPTPTPPTSPSIRITTVPVKDCEGGEKFDKDIAGEVTGADPKIHAVVLYAHTIMWYVQPTTVAYLTDIGGDGSWSSTINGGCTYAALLVERNKFKMTTRVPDLPRAGVIAWDKKEGR